MTIINVVFLFPQFFVLFVRKRTVANIDSIGLVVLMNPVLCWIIVERQHFSFIFFFKQSIAFGCPAKAFLEGRRRDKRHLWFSPSDILQCFFHPWLYAFGHFVKHIRGLMYPAPLLTRLRPAFSDSFPKQAGHLRRRASVLTVITMLVAAQ